MRKNKIKTRLVLDRCSSVVVSPVHGPPQALDCTRRTAHAVECSGNIGGAHRSVSVSIETVNWPTPSTRRSCTWPSCRHLLALHHEIKHWNQTIEDLGLCLSFISKYVNFQAIQERVFIIASFIVYLSFYH